MNVYEAINAVMTELKPIGKNGFNQQQKYQYRGVDDVMSAISPLMQKYGLFIVPVGAEVVREQKNGSKSVLLYSNLVMKYRIYSADGTYIEAEVPGEGMDSGDKATNKALSATFKYLILQTFCIPTAELVDSESDSPVVVNEMHADEPPKLNPQDLAAFTSDLNAANVNIPELCRMYRVNSLGDMTVQMANEIIAKVNNNRQ